MSNRTPKTLSKRKLEKVSKKFLNKRKNKNPSVDHVANRHHRNRGDSHHPSTKAKDDSLPSQPKLLPRPATDSRLLMTHQQSHHHVATTLVCNSQWWKISTVNHYFSTPLCDSNRDKSWPKWNIELSGHHSKSTSEEARRTSLQLSCHKWMLC